MNIEKNNNTCKTNWEVFDICPNAKSIFIEFLKELPDLELATESFEKKEYIDIFVPLNYLYTFFDKYGIYNSTWISIRDRKFGFTVTTVDGEHIADAIHNNRYEAENACFDLAFKALEFMHHQMEEKMNSEDNKDSSDTIFRSVKIKR